MPEGVDEMHSVMNEAISSKPEGDRRVWMQQWLKQLQEKVPSVNLCSGKEEEGHRRRFSQYTLRNEVVIVAGVESADLFKFHAKSIAEDRDDALDRLHTAALNRSETLKEEFRGNIEAFLYGKDMSELRIWAAVVIQRHWRAYKSGRWVITPARPLGVEGGGTPVGLEVFANEGVWQELKERGVASKDVKARYMYAPRDVPVLKPGMRFTGTSAAPRSSRKDRQSISGIAPRSVSSSNMSNLRSTLSMRKPEILDKASSLPAQGKSGLAQSSSTPQMLLSPVEPLPEEEDSMMDKPDCTFRTRSKSVNFAVDDENEWLTAQEAVQFPSPNLSSPVVPLAEVYSSPLPSAPQSDSILYELEKSHAGPSNRAPLMLVEPLDDGGYSPEIPITVSPFGHMVQAAMRPGMNAPPVSQSAPSNVLKASPSILSRAAGRVAERRAAGPPSPTSPPSPLRGLTASISGGLSPSISPKASVNAGARTSNRIASRAASVSFSEGISATMTGFRVSVTGDRLPVYQAAVLKHLVSPHSPDDSSEGGPEDLPMMWSGDEGRQQMLDELQEGFEESKDAASSSRHRNHRFRRLRNASGTISTPPDLSPPLSSPSASTSVRSSSGGEGMAGLTCLNMGAGLFHAVDEDSSRRDAMRSRTARVSSLGSKMNINPHPAEPSGNSQRSKSVSGHPLDGISLLTGIYPGGHDQQALSSPALSPASSGDGRTMRTNRATLQPSKNDLSFLRSHSQTLVQRPSLAGGPALEGRALTPSTLGLSVSTVVLEADSARASHSGLPAHVAQLMRRQQLASKKGFNAS